MWGDRAYIEDSIKVASEDCGNEVSIVEVYIRSEIAYIVLKNIEGVFLAEYRANENGTATRIEE